jgi:tripartite-type tricarboxylate transporter receptor subunit TctC
MRPIWALCAALAGMSGIAFGQAALAQQWPAHAVVVVSPFVGGTTNDLVAEIVLDHVGEALGHPFIIENRPGGGGAVGVASVVHAKPDGYTLLLSSSAMSAAAILQKSLPYDPVHDLEPVAMFGGQPSVLLAAPGYKTVADLVAAAKAKPGALKFASAGFASPSYFAAEHFVVAAGLNVKHVPYTEPFNGLTDLMAGRIDFYFVPIPPAQPLIAQGKAVALAVTMPTRVDALPDVPTLTELGYPGAPFLFWAGLSAPANTPSNIVDNLNGAVHKVQTLGPVIERFESMGVIPMLMSPKEYGQFFATDMAVMTRLGNQAHITPSE